MQHPIELNDIEQHVVGEIVRILRSPEVIMNLNKLAETQNEISKDKLMTALTNLNEVWNYLYKAEQRKIIDMLVKCIVVQDNGIKIDLNLEGFDELILNLAS